MGRFHRHILPLFLRQEGFCYYCKTPCNLYKDERLSKEALYENDVGRYPDLATIEHLYPRTDMRRYAQAEKGMILKVMACNQCNYEMSLKFDYLAKAMSGLRPFDSRWVDFNPDPYPDLLRELLKGNIDMLLETPK